MQIKIRDFKESDKNAVLSYWIKSAYISSVGKREAISVFHRGMQSVIEKKNDAGELICRVACLEDDEDIILGFAVFGTNYALHYVYVKEPYQRMGICKKLLRDFYKDRTGIVVSFWNKNVRHIDRVYECKFDRFKLFN